MITSMKEVSTSTTTDEHSPLMKSSVLEIGARSQSVSQSVSLLAASDQTDRGRSKSFPTTTSRAVITMIMDEESPWRCRRTDGKKWRCKRNVVPDHKYCDRHINRGRLRSRKPVEQQQQEQHQQPLPHFHPADHPQTKNDGGGGGGCSKVSVRVGGVAVSSTTAAPSLATTAADHSRVDVSHHFSPKSVLPGKTAKGSCIYGGEEEELRRCRRTDGKKWRCRREVVYNQKYCDRHLHRGAKRRPEVAATSGGIPPFLHCSNLLPRKASCILTQAAVAQDDDNVCNSNTSSDATVSEGRLYY